MVDVVRRFVVVDRENGDLKQNITLKNKFMPSPVGIKT